MEGALDVERFDSCGLEEGEVLAEEDGVFGKKGREVRLEDVKALIGKLMKVLVGRKKNGEGETKWS